MNRQTAGVATVPTELDPAIVSDAISRASGAVARVILPATLTSRYASDLLDDLRALRGQPLSLDASSVQQIGALCLQVLLSARETWSADGQPFSMTDVSEEMARRWSLFGLPPGQAVECEG